MSGTQQVAAGIVSVVLVAIYSIVMTTSSGASSWAWIMLVAALVLLAATARSVATARSQRRDG